MKALLKRIDAVPASGMWLAMLYLCVLASGGVALVIVILAAIFAGLPGATSALLAAVVVVAFFSISLLIGHVYAQRAAAEAIYAFILAYVIKVIAFGALLLGFGRPDWISAPWFVAGALAVVVVWQVCEMLVATRSRRLYMPGAEDERSGETEEPVAGEAEEQDAQHSSPGQIKP